MVNSEYLADIFLAAKKLSGEFVAHRTMFAAGQEIGRGIIKTKTINDPRVFMDVIREFFEKNDLGELKNPFEPKEKKYTDYPTEFVISVYNSPFSKLEAGKEPQCSFTRGILRGAYSQFKDWGNVSVTETKCVVAGSDHCEFEVKKGPAYY